MSAHQPSPVPFTSEAVEFGAPGERLRGTLYLPADADGEIPGVVLGHGWGMCAGGDLEDYARAIVERGIAALTFDFRRLGKSDGLPRQDIDPYWQVEDYRTAITWLSARPEVASRNIGIWGSSYSGGHVLIVAATDSRVKAVVSQVPTISGYEAGLRKTHPEKLDALREVFHADRLARLNGEAPGMIQTVGTPDETNVAYPGADSYDYMSGQGKIVPEWRNEVTLRSLDAARAYEPGTWIDRIAPKPLLMIVATGDLTTPSDMQLEAYAKARHPKELMLLPGGHYSAYQEHFDTTSVAAADWFSTHLESTNS
ncbi:alpha/beta hydrolase [Homoserinimonas sp. A447]